MSSKAVGAAARDDLIDIAEATADLAERAYKPVGVAIVDQGEAQVTRVGAEIQCIIVALSIYLTSKGRIIGKDKPICPAAAIQ